ncbi:ribose-5-phosphate isomerase RpiA [Treponema lecithinolyticum]|uniref:Ribose-5-phosphate isomerase A n=1 Tax=Treponema lecithinolyticum ATCC 700332 TaxID=1321815 RepID=A0ABN0P0W2_TRELE|nr:ribose-5-phosphate isomerase RpiA [Treponema lecithinolyticum]ERJ93954.1 ribose 5-phosphate isomerase A [Treponema lecithinolyticum ATCC 700332]
MNKNTGNGAAKTVQKGGLSQKEQKALVGKTAVDRLIEKGFIKSGMKIGLGTGSTAIVAVDRLALYIREGKLSGIKAVATSFQTHIACEENGIPVFTLNSKEIGGTLDLAIDGADEIDPENNLIKGGGAAHVQEKIVEYNSKRLVIIADESKLVPHLGTRFPLPVEIIAAARTPVVRAMEKLGASCVLRTGSGKDGPVITDNGNQILDCTWSPLAGGTSPVDPSKMEDKVNKITGVVENGFFTKNRPIVFIARADGSVEERD